MLAVTVPISHGHWGRVPELLVRRGVQVTMVASDRPRAEDMVDGVNYQVIPMRRAVSPVADLGALARWHMLLRDIRPDAVVAATPKAGMLAMVAARASGIRVRNFHVWGCRWDGQRGVRAQLAKLGDRLACAAASDVVAVGAGVRTLLHAEGITRKHVRVLGSGGSKGVDLSRFLYRAPRIGSDVSPVIGFAGRLARDKGMEYLLPVLHRVERGVPGARLVIAGGADEADPESRAIMDALRASPAVTMVGELDDMPSFLSGIDVLCFPSLREGLPNVVIEAAACGVPTVAWRVTGLPDTVVDGSTGFLVPRGEVDVLAQRIEELLRFPVLRADMARRGREFVEARFGSAHVQEMHADDILASLGE